MIKKTLCFSNPAYLSLHNAQLAIRLPEVETCNDLPDSFKANRAYNSNRRHWSCTAR